MRKLVILILFGALAACSQTAGSGEPQTNSLSAPASQARQATDKQAASKKADSCDEAIQAQANSAMLSGALGMVGSFGGLGGRGGAVAAQMASSAGGMMARAQSQKAQEAVMRACHLRGY